MYTAQPLAIEASDKTKFSILLLTNPYIKSNRLI